MQKKSKSGKKPVILITIVIVAAIAVFLVMKFTKEGVTSVSGKAYVRAIDSVNSADPTSVNRFSGKVETQKTEKVKFDTSMTLGECYVQKDQHVEQGDNLFSYDTQTLQIEVQQKQLEIERLNTTISNDNEQINTLNAQMSKAAASEQLEFSAQILELQAEVAQSEYSIKVAQSEIDKKNKSIENSIVTAPIAGTITELNDIASITDDTAYMVITADGEFRVKAKVSEQNIVDVQEGERVLLRSRIDDTQTWLGTISTIEKQASTDQNDSGYYSDNSDNTASNYTFYVELESTDGLMLGQHLLIEKYIGQDELADGIWLTSGWIVNDGEESYVWASKGVDGKLEKRQVTLGEYREDADIYKIESGLSDTDYIAWPDDDYKEGMAVAVKQADTGSSADGDSSSGDDADNGNVDDDMTYMDGTAEETSVQG